MVPYIQGSDASADPVTKTVDPGLMPDMLEEGMEVGQETKKSDCDC